PGLRSTDVRPAEVRDDAAAWRALDEPQLEQVRLVDVLDRVRLLAESDRQRRQADRTAAELADDRLEQGPVDALETVLLDLEQVERLVRDLGRDGALVAHLGDVADAPQNPVRDAWRAAGAPRDLVRRLVGDLDREDPRRAADNVRELVRAVVVEPEGHAEAVAERGRQEPRPRRRPD